MMPETWRNVKGVQWVLGLESDNGVPGYFVSLEIVIYFLLLVCNILPVLYGYQASFLQVFYGAMVVFTLNIQNQFGMNSRKCPIRLIVYLV